MLQKFPMYSYIPAKDVARARAFYEGKLGFRPKTETAGGVVYEFGLGTACFLYPSAPTTLLLAVAPRRHGSKTPKSTSWRWCRTSSDRESAAPGLVIVKAATPVAEDMSSD